VLVVPRDQPSELVLDEVARLACVGAAAAGRPVEARRSARRLTTGFLLLLGRGARAARALRSSLTRRAPELAEADGNRRRRSLAGGDEGGDGVGRAR